MEWDVNDMVVDDMAKNILSPIANSISNHTLLVNLIAKVKNEPFLVPSVAPASRALVKVVRLPTKLIEFGL